MDCTIVNCRYDLLQLRHIHSIGFCRTGSYVGNLAGKLYSCIISVSIYGVDHSTQRHRSCRGYPCRARVLFVVNLTIGNRVVGVFPVHSGAAIIARKLTFSSVRNRLRTQCDTSLYISMTAITNRRSKISAVNCLNNAACYGRPCLGKSTNSNRSCICATISTICRGLYPDSLALTAAGGCIVFRCPSVLA